VQGQRYNAETLEVKYRGKNISEVLEMTVEEGLSFFENIPKIRRRLEVLYDVGLGYIKIGQSSTYAVGRGGVAGQARHRDFEKEQAPARPSIILDEHTTGLHAADVHRLILVLQRLVEGGTPS
jgi:excinuclease ABC subunit A